MRAAAFIIGAMATLSLSACATVSAPAATTGFMARGEAVAAPSGFQDFCQRDASACAAPALTADSRPGPSLKPADWALLKKVNDEVNRRIQPREDAEIYGVPERWIDPLAAHLNDASFTADGDCEDYALAKRDLLVAAGWPEDKLFYAVAYDRNVGLHAVLIARTATADLVLDSRTPWIVAWTKAPYVWLKRQTAGGSTDWVRPYDFKQPNVQFAGVSDADESVTAALAASR